MKLLKAVSFILLLAKIGMAQTDPKIYSTMKFFYIDNSSLGTAPGLNKEVKNFLKLKMNEVENLKDNYECTFTVDGEFSILSDNVTKTVSFDHLTQYLSRSTGEAHYVHDNDTLNATFIHSPVAIKEELTFYIFLSSKAVDKMVKEMNDMPTPVTFPYQLASFITHEKVIHPIIYLIVNKDVSKKYTEPQLIRCFTFYKDKSDVSPEPKIMYK